MCGFVAQHRCQLDIDHIDGNHLNEDFSNLQLLCANCHRLKTYLNEDWTYEPKVYNVELKVVNQNIMDINKCIRCGQSAILNLKEDRSIWFCMAHGMEYADIKSGKYEKGREA